MYILPPSIPKRIEGYRWQSFTPPAAGKSRRFRGLVCHRRIHGEGNDFCLGSIGKPSLSLLAYYALKTLNLWFWFGAFITYSNKVFLAKIDPDIRKDYLAASKKAQEVAPWLIEQFDHVLAQEKAIHSGNKT